MTEAELLQFFMFLAELAANSARPEQPKTTAAVFQALSQRRAAPGGFGFSG